MTISTDRWFKRLWVVNGVLLLVFLLLCGALVGYQLYQELRLGRGQYAVSMPDTARSTSRGGSRAVRYGEPREVLGTETRIVTIHYGSEFTQRGAGFAGLYGGYYASGPLVNVAFLDSSGARLLFDRPAYIQDLDFPSEPEDSLQKWISYEVVLQDRNLDGELSEDDGPTLFISDLEGRRLRSVLPPEYVVIRHGPYMGGRFILIYALEVPSGVTSLRRDEYPQRAFLYDSESDSVTLYEELNRVIETASDRLAR